MRGALVDSSVLVAAVLEDEADHDVAVRFLQRMADDGVEPLVAAHGRFEVRHAIVFAANRGRLAWGDVRVRLGLVDGLDATVVPLSPEDRPVLRLAEAHRLTWADAHWVEIAARLDLPLVTADQRLILAVPDEVAILVDVREAAA
ncbi:MAG: type II toxin-antitoxin system VapC family toxin [Chloroflexota bacterium]